MQAQYDVTVIGAGPAGATAAIAFARRGATVLLAEANPKAASRFAGEWMHPPGVRVLERLGKFFARRELIETYLPLLGLGASGEVYTRYVQLLRSSKSLQLAVAREQLAMSVAGEFLRIAPAERSALFDLFQQLRLGVNLQKEFFSLCFEISRRDKISINQLLQGAALRGILKNARLSVPQKTALVRDHLKRLRYPRLSEKERQFQSVVKRLGLVPGAALHAPPYFEGTTYRMELRFETYVELRDRLAQLQERVTQRLGGEDFE